MGVRWESLTTSKRSLKEDDAKRTKSGRKITSRGYSRREKIRRETSVKIVNEERVRACLCQGWTVKRKPENNLFISSKTYVDSGGITRSSSSKHGPNVNSYPTW